MHHYKNLNQLDFKVKGQCSTAWFKFKRIFNDPRNLQILVQRGRTTNGKIGPVTDQIHEVWNCTIFVITGRQKAVGYII